MIFYCLHLNQLISSLSNADSIYFLSFKLTPTTGTPYHLDKILTKNQAWVPKSCLLIQVRLKYLQSNWFLLSLNYTHTNKHSTGHHLAIKTPTVVVPIQATTINTPWSFIRVRLSRSKSWSPSSSKIFPSSNCTSTTSPTLLLSTTWYSSLFSFPESLPETLKATRKRKRTRTLKNFSGFILIMNHRNHWSVLWINLQYSTPAHRIFTDPFSIKRSTVLQLDWRWPSDWLGLLISRYRYAGSVIILQVGDNKPNDVVVLQSVTNKHSRWQTVVGVFNGLVSIPTKMFFVRDCSGWCQAWEISVFAMCGS